MTRQPGSAPVALLLVLAALADAAAAATITVNSSLDAAANYGLCTLREAIVSANNNVASGGMANECAAGQAFPTVDQIHFAIPGGADAVQTITPTAALPPLTAAVVIDGYTQGNASPNTQPIGTDAELLIEIDGSALPSGAVLLNVNTDGATIRGLVINKLANNSTGLWINSHDGNTISGNYIETDPSGSSFSSSGNPINSPVNVAGNSNHVGGTNPGDRNVIAGGQGFGASTVVIAGTGNIVQGNYIGVSADGTSALQPGAPVYAIDLSYQGASSGTLIGGTGPGAGNVIYGGAYAIHMRYSINATVIQGNYIGTDATGAHALGGGGYGIMIIGATNTTIGGVGAGNVISGYGDAITTYGGEAEPGTVIQGNLIGTDSSGTHAIPNSGTGIHIGSPGVDLALTATQSKVGGTAPGEGNTIANSCGAGIAFDNSASYTRWPILGNSIHSNNSFGIKLGLGGLPQPNDAGDGDLGPNNLQNCPIITSAPVTSGSVSISGTLNSTPSKLFRIEFFSGIGCHASGSGEGRHFIGAMNAVMTNASGDATLNSPPFSVPTGHTMFTATATDPDGNTSEFSQCFGTPNLLFHDDFEDTCAGYD